MNRAPVTADRRPGRARSTPGGKVARKPTTARPMPTSPTGTSTGSASLSPPTTAAIPTDRARGPHHAGGSAGVDYLDQTALRYLQVVGAETSRLSRLINNVLNLARQQRDRLSVQLRTGVLDEVVEKTTEYWRALLEGRQIAIDLSLGAPAKIKLDADAITQILGNLLSNVEKYAAQGKYVRIATEMDETSARLIVQDRGPGIADGKREIVFEAFERLRSDLTEGVSGTGIGLTISRELGRLHGGTLEVDVNYREGSRFVLTIPRTNP